MRYDFIQASLTDQELVDISIAKRCEVLEVSVSGYYAWAKRQRMPVQRTKRISDDTIIKQANIIRNEMKYTPGYRQMHALMRQKGIRIGVKRLRDVLRVNGIIGYRHFKRTVRTTDSNHNMFVYPNLLGRNFAPGELNKAWVSDITYLPTSQGWGFLATIMDLGSRRILGWAIDTSMTTDLVLTALNMAVRARGQNAVAGTIIHSDRGTQYCSAAFQNRLRQLNMRCSMSDAGQCWDNAPGESIWSSLKRETLIGRKRFDSLEQAVASVNCWIGLYNTVRPHSTIGMQAPMDYEMRLLNVSRGTTYNV